MTLGGVWYLTKSPTLNSTILTSQPTSLWATVLWCTAYTVYADLNASTLSLTQSMNARVDMVAGSLLLAILTNST